MKENINIQPVNKRDFLEKNFTPADVVLETEGDIKSIGEIFNYLKSINFDEKENTDYQKKLDEVAILSNKVVNIFQEFINWIIKENGNQNEKSARKMIEIKNSFHILKGSFAQINGMCGEMKDFNSKDDFDGYLEIIVETIEKSKIDLENLKEEEFEEIKFEKINLTEHIRRIIGMPEKIAKAKNIKIHNNISGDIRVIADNYHLESIFINLISNAIKFTNIGGNITLSSHQEGNFVKIFIEDDGVGISKEKQKDLFNNPGNTTIGTKGEVGTGVGMYTVGEFMKEIGGSINVESEEGKGTTFIITLPVAK